MDESSPEKKAGLLIVGSILICLSVAALVFSIRMLFWAIEELGYEGEQWGIFGIWFYGGIGLCVMILFLLPIVLLISGIKGMPPIFRTLSTIVILAAIFTDGAAIVLTFRSTSQHEQRFIERSPLYQSGLRQAILGKDVKQAESILKANPNLIWKTDYQGYSVLMLAVRAGDQAMVRMLLKQGANVRETHYSRGTPLHIAAVRGDVQMAELLLEEGAQVNEEDSEQKTALVYAKEAGQKEMVDFLIERGGKDVDDHARLIRAVEESDTRVVAELLDQGLSIDTALPNGHNLLDIAAEEDDLKMARFLISRGASVKRADKYGRTSLHWACGEGNVEMVKYLIDRGAKVDAKDWEGITPLHEAIFSSQRHEDKSLDVVKVLVEANADINAENNNGVSPLEHAQKYGTDSIRAYIRESGKASDK